MTGRVPRQAMSTYDIARTSWFALEDAVDDWCDVAELDEEKTGTLKNKLEGDATAEEQR